MKLTCELTLSCSDVYSSLINLLTVSFSHFFVVSAFATAHCRSSQSQPFPLCQDCSNQCSQALRQCQRHRRHSHPFFPRHATQRKPENFFDQASTLNLVLQSSEIHTFHHHSPSNHLETSFLLMPPKGGTSFMTVHGWLFLGFHSGPPSWSTLFFDVCNLPLPSNTHPAHIQTALC